MPISEKVVNCGFREDGHVVVPVSGTSQWKTVIDAGGPDGQDNSGTITNPDSHIAGAATHIFRRERGQGTTLRLRLGYDDGISAPTSPVVKVFGRSAVFGDGGSVESADAWQLLLTKGGDETGTLTIDLTNDAQDGTYGYTTPDPQGAAWDCEGCNEFIVGIATALTATGTVDTAFIQAKFL